MSADDANEPRCPACGGPGRDRRYHIDHYDLYRCRLCRTEFLVENAGREPVGRTYWDAYKFEIYADEAVQAEYEARYASIFDRIEPMTKSISTVLDIGCGIGNFLHWAQERGLDPIGADVDDDAMATARGRGLDVWHIDEVSEHVAPGSVDVVTLWDVIEHVSDPLEMLSQAARLVRPGGLVAMETPDVTFPMRPFVIGLRKVAEPIRWSDMLYYADHQTYFSPRGLSTLMGRSGLEVVDQQGMRSPNTKMAGLVQHWADQGSGAGRLGPLLYQPLDTAMRTIRMTNKLIMVGRRPD